MTATTTPAATAPAIDFKKKYEETTEAGNSTLHNPQAKNIAEKVHKIFFDGLVPKAETELNAKVQDAAAKLDFEAMKALIKQHDEIKANENKDRKVLDDIRRQGLPTVVKAFRGEFEAIVYQIAYEVLTSTHTAVTEAAKSSKGGRTKATTTTSDDSAKRHQTTYKISKGDQSVTFPIRMGRAAVNLKQDEEAFTLLGFKVEKDEDGKDVLNPATIEQADGKEALANRKSIVAAIEAKLKGFEDFTVEDISEAK